MKINKFILIILFIYFGNNRMFSQNNPFTTIYPSDINTVLNSDFIQNDTIDITSIQENICGISLDCKVFLHDRKSLARIILEDVDGNNFLVLECNKRLYDADTITFSKYCRETNFLSNIVPKQLKIYLKDATVNLHKINLSKSFNARNISILPTTTDSIKKEQIKALAEKINENNIKHNKPKINVNK